MGCGASTASAPTTTELKPEAMTVPTTTTPSEPAQSKATTEVSAGPLDRSALLKQVFEAIDKDKNGMVDIKEFMNTADKEDKEMELTMLHSFMDDTTNGGNGDGKLSLEEWINGMSVLSGSSNDADFEKELKHMLQLLEHPVVGAPPASDLEALFASIDADGDGKVTRSELSAKLSATEEVQRLLEAAGGTGAMYVMEQLDENGDGEVV
uniref:EF-hand domain-containing protein n=1 Tax=Haptolina brevifila TaxID=156173 RepID=A0A7S2H3Z5_9EUKA|mmetsp:Transcript_51005/g.101452  ORF Transcript_51005/g.101452 Transcript_51005/m.101452 type:complete len:209 (+) Transcript_51005:164-790(+)